jgi:AcrR family transcriptional regulator
MSRNYGYQNVTRADIASAAGCSEALVSSYFGTMVQVRRAVVRAAIKQRDLAIIAQAIAANDPHVKRASVDLCNDAIRTLKR